MGHGRVSSQWRYSHDYRHHVCTNVLEIDDDLGFGVMRLSRDQPWRPGYLVQSLRNLLLAITFKWGIALHGIHVAQNRAETEGGEGPLLAFASGNLCYQFEHHLFPDLRSNRYAQIATRVRALCGQVRPSLHHRLAAGPVSAEGTDHPYAALPDRFLTAASRHNAVKRSQSKSSTPTHRPTGLRPSNL